MKSVKVTLRILTDQILKKLGYQLIKYPCVDLLRRMSLVNQYKIDTLFDIGANSGQYAITMRELGYNERIISFEPLKTAYGELEKNSINDKDWIVNNYALGNNDIKSIINISANSVSSSILNILPMCLDSAPESRYIAQEEIEIKKLDSVFNSYCTIKNRVMLKIDTQGYEKNVIDGANKFLDRIYILQVEMSLRPLYESQMLFSEMIDYLDNKGFRLAMLENGFSDSKTGQLLQVDGIFVKKTEQ